MCYANRRSELWCLTHDVDRNPGNILREAATAVFVILAHANASIRLVGRHISG